jgi:carbon monoxide dehydrogenase subunit G
MQLEHSFTVPVGIDDAWKTLLDIEQVAPCMPGAALETVDGDSFTGLVKVKLGPISLTYKGKASFIEKDEAAHRATIDAQGKDSRGNGTAAAKVTATLTSAGAATTKVDVLTDLNITGKPAQFGRGVMVDVGNKLIGQFADNLSAQLSESSTVSAEPAVPAEPAGPAGAAAPANGAANGAIKAPAKRAPAKAATTAATTTAAATATKATVTAPAKAAAPTKAAPAKAAAAAEPKAAAEPQPAADAPAADAPAAETPAASVPRVIASREVEPIDLMASAGPAVAKRVIPLAAVVAVVLAVLFARRRRR